MLDELESKTVHKAEEGDRGKRSKMMSEVKPVENIKFSRDKSRAKGSPSFT